MSNLVKGGNVSRKIQRATALMYGSRRNHILDTLEGIRDMVLLVGSVVVFVLIFGAIVGLVIWKFISMNAGLS